ncbi:O-succinylhomoserine sulfhydrylase [soil metagenome]
MSSNKPWSLETQAIRAGIERSQFGEHSEPIHLTSSFVFTSAAEAAERFANRSPGNVYSRFTNPTVTTFQTRLAALEGTEACLATASGMSAILTACMGLMSAGDHLLASSGLFGATVQLFSSILSRFGIETSYADPTDPEAWRRAMRPNTKLLFAETPSNPMMQVADIAALASIAHEGGALLAIDNCFCTPVLQRPAEFGADIVVHSATKFLDGQGRVLGGALCATDAIVRDKLLPVLRTCGPSLSPFNAWVLLKGLETLSIRVERQSANALTLARRLEAHPAIARVIHPGLDSFGQRELVARQQSGGGSLISFEVKGDSPEQLRRNAWQVVDSTRLLSITANLGDTKTTITHPATTTHGRVTPEARQAAGIGEGLLRVAVGLESVDDLYDDIVTGLERKAA